MKQERYTLEHLVSPEILAEVQNSFVKKHSMGLCFYANDRRALTPYPVAMAALKKLSEQQRALFTVFFEPFTFAIDTSFPSERPTFQSFAQSTLFRSIFPIFFEKKQMGFAVLLQFTKNMQPARDDRLLQALALVGQQQVPLVSFEDELAAFPANKTSFFIQEIRNMVKLFLEAGNARAQVDNNEVEEKPEPAPIAPASNDSSIGILFCSPNGQIVDTSSSVSDFLGYENPEELCDLNLFDDLLASQGSKNSIRDLFHSEPGATATVFFQLHGGSTIPVASRIEVQRASKEIIGFECHLFWPRENPKTEPIESQNFSLAYDKNKLAELQHIYARLGSQLTRFIEPLSERLARIDNAGPASGAINKELAGIRRLAETLAGMSHQLQYFTGQYKANRESVRLNALMQEIAARVQQFLPHAIKLETNFDERITSIDVDPDALVHAVGSLCKNAIDAMPAGGLLALTTTLVKTSNGQRVAISVTDTGSGFPDAARAHLFEPFHAQENRRLGAGLGLAAVYGIVKSLHGDISVASADGHGSSLKIELPFADTSPADLQPTATKGNILIIDDEIDIAEATAMSLRRQGYAVFSGVNSDEAFDIFQQVDNNIDLIILDNQLAGTSGKACAKEILARVPDVPIVFYSGADDDFDLMTFIEHIGAGWLKKPFSSRELSRLVDEMILKKKQKLGY